MDITFPGLSFKVETIKAIVPDGTSVAFTNAEDAAEYYARESASQQLHDRYQELLDAGDARAKIQYAHCDYLIRADYKAADAECVRLAKLYTQEHFELSTKFYEEFLPVIKAILPSKHQGR